MEEPIKQAILKNNFFHDFIFFLNTLRLRPFTLTKTGNLQREEINYFGKQFKIDIYHRDEKGNIMWPIYTEYEIPHLQRIRLISAVMYLTYKRKGKLFLSNNGKGYLTNINFQTQFEQMVLWYFNRCNWSYMHPYYDDLASVLQKNQRTIWNYFLRNQYSRIDFKNFIEGLSAYLKLEDSASCRDRIKWAIERTIVKDAILYGLLDCETQKQDWFEEIISFKPTLLGIHIFQKALFEPF